MDYADHTRNYGKLDKLIMAIPDAAQEAQRPNSMFIDRYRSTAEQKCLDYLTAATWLASCFSRWYKMHGADRYIAQFSAALNDLLAEEWYKRPGLQPNPGDVGLVDFDEFTSWILAELNERNSGSWLVLPPDILSRYPLLAKVAHTTSGVNNHSRLAETFTDLLGQEPTRKPPQI